ncbi:MAG: threonine synthase [Planctomycetota bacterium]|nr:threonine synthase [Planctomycetota bacterium]
MGLSEHAFQKCISADCGATFDLGQALVACPVCGSLVDVDYDWDRLPVPTKLSDFERFWQRKNEKTRFSGVWRFHELIPFASEDLLVTVGEGQTLLQEADQVGRYVGMEAGNLFLQYEGMNPSGSFKDNGMCAAFTHARSVGATRAACASTGNTSASLAMYCSVTNLMKAIIFVGSGKISYGKLSQALDYGALTIQILGDFDDAMNRVKQVTSKLGIYLVNSVNAFRLEGQKSIVFRILEALRWEVPDWIVVPGGNLGNSSSFGKALIELKKLGLIDRLPRLAVINSGGARTLFELYEQQGLRWKGGRVDDSIESAYYAELDRQNAKASTLASAIEINRPVNLRKCLRALDACEGVVRQVSDQDALDAKAKIAAGGMGCEPASATSVAGAKCLREEGVIAASDRVVCVLTGHQLKDPNVTVAYHSTDRQEFESVLGGYGVQRASFANHAIGVPNDLDDIIKAIKLYS